MDKLKEFLKELVDSTKQDVISIVLFGSAAKGKFKIGKSDIDLIFVVDDKTKKKELEKKLFYIVLNLDRKYNLKLSKACFGFNDGICRRVVLAIENMAYFRMPFGVFSIDELNFENTNISNWKIFLISKLLGSMKSFAVNIKKDGVTIYGKDLISKLKVSPLTRMEKLKFHLTIFWVFIFGLICLPFDWKFSMEHFNKARKYKLNLDNF
jgi:predicted nucleotidyltransferase